MFELFSKTTCNIIDADSVTVGVLDGTDYMTGQFCTTYQQEENHSFKSDHCSLSGSLLKALVRKHCVLRIAELASNQLAVSSKHLAKRPFLGISFVASSTSFGLFYFVGKAKGLTFSLEDEHLAATMAAELRVLYENIQLYETIQKHAIKLQLEVAERKRMASDLLHTQERLKLALEAGKMNGWEWDIQADQIHEFGHFVLLANPVLKIGSAVKCGSFEHFMLYVVPEDRTRVSRAFEQILSEGMKLDIQFRAHMIDGSIQWIAAHGQIFRDRKGLPQRMVGIGAIITEQKKTEETSRLHQIELARLARVNSMSEMASTLAHELNQPLTAINSYISGCVRRLDEGLEDKALIILTMQKAMKNIELAGEIIHRMKNFAREGELNYEKIVMNDLIDEVVSLIHYETPDNSVSIQFEFDINLPLIEADKVQIEQVLLNLIRNALDVMRNANVLEPTLIIKTTKSHVLTVSVTDNGPGIALNVSHLLFSPYFTTKVDGMGMGLAICRSIIEAHSGQLSAFNTAAGGACFQFSLPFIDLNTYE